MTRRRLHRWLAAAAALAGGLAPLAGRRSNVDASAPIAGRHGTVDELGQIAGGRGTVDGLAPSAGRGTIDVGELAREVSAEQDHVSAVELAEWLRARRPGLRVIDVRSAAEYAAFHIPGAEHVPLASLAGARFAPGDTIVAYSEAGAHGAQAWVFLRALGHRRVYFLRRGLHEWLDDVMSPTLAADASPDERAAFARAAPLSRWFGGLPRVLGTGNPAPAPVRGRGC